MPYAFPDIPETYTCSMLFIPSYLLPIVGAVFSAMEKRVRWNSDTDWERGYRAFTEMQDQLMNSCLDDLIAEIRAFRGIKPEFVDTPLEDRTIDMYNDVGDVLDHLLTILYALRGTDEITDNIILALRGTVEADADRNIADLLT